MNTLMESVLKMYQWLKPYIEMNKRRKDLRELLDELKDKVEDMDKQVRFEEQNGGGNKKRKRTVKAYFDVVRELREAARATLNEGEEAGLLRRMMVVPSVERHLSIGKEYLDRGSRLEMEGLTYDELRLRGERFGVRELMGRTALGHLQSALAAINTNKACCIGIYGPAGVGKTTLMKHLYNAAYDDKDGFKAVFWAAAPKYIGVYALQECVSEGMWFDFNDEDCVRRASLLAKRGKEMAGSGRIILFLDNLREEFDAYQVLGLSPRHCVLVFTAPSLDVCNRMHASARTIIKMDRLPEDEAIQLFLHEAGISYDNNVRLTNNELRIQEVAIRVAKQCASLPLAIILIAKSMTGVDDIREWRNRLGELMEEIDKINDEDEKILQQLKFGYACLKDKATHGCFVAAAKLLVDSNNQVFKEDMIFEWRKLRLIGNKQSPQEAVFDQGHTILNQLQRMCLLEIGEHNQSVTMNKWIRKLADTL